MSNYLFVIADASAKGSVSRWVASHNAEDEARSIGLDDGRTLYIVSKCIEDSIRGDEYMRGTLVSEEPPALVFGIDGWLASKAHISPDEAGGEFLHAAWTDSELSITRDVFGNARLMYFSGCGVAAASDSLLVLLDLQLHLGMRVALDEQVLLARAALNGVAGQQTSSRTVVDSVRFLPAGFGLRSHRRDWIVVGRSMGERVDARGESDMENLRGGARRVAEVVAALACVPHWIPVLSLSGGYDSRLVLAGVVSSGAAAEFRASTIYNGSEWSRDYEVGKALGRHFGVRVADGVADQNGPDRAPSQMELWASSIFGVYDGFGPRLTYQRVARRFGVTGIGAEIHKGNWGWRDASALLDFAAPSGVVRHALAQELELGLREAGADPGVRNASELYYLAFRNGLHGASAHLSLHMTNVAPVMQFSLARAAHRRVHDDEGALGFSGSASGIRDMTAILSPEVCSFEYDDPRRNISYSEALERQRVLGGGLGRIEPARIFGDPLAVPAGASGFSFSVARNRGLVGELRADEIVSFGIEVAGRFQSSELRTTYLALGENARWRLGRYDGDLRRSGVSPARMLTLRVLFALGLTDFLG